MWDLLVMALDLSSHNELGGNKNVPLAPMCNTSATNFSSRKLPCQSLAPLQKPGDCAKMEHFVNVIKLFSKLRVVQMLEIYSSLT